MPTNAEISNYYTKLDQKEGVHSIVQCSALVFKTWTLSTGQTKSNAFRFEGTSCEIGVVSSTFEFPVRNGDLLSGTNIGYILTDFFGKSKFNDTLGFKNAFFSD